MRSRLFLFTSLAVMGCSAGPPRQGAESSSLHLPLTPTLLTEGHFVAYTLLWQVSVPGGDPIVFHSDGTVENLRAGLAGRWAITDDSTLTIQSVPTGGATAALAGPPMIFRLWPGRGALVSPARPDSLGEPIYQIRPRGDSPAAAP